jgi:hypothetical protein
MRLHRTDNLRLIAQFAITTISRPESAIWRHAVSHVKSRIVIGTGLLLAQISCLATYTATTEMPARGRAASAPCSFQTPSTAASCPAWTAFTNSW